MTDRSRQNHTSLVKTLGLLIFLFVICAALLTGCAGQSADESEALPDSSAVTSQEPTESVQPEENDLPEESEPSEEAEEPIQEEPTSATDSIYDATDLYDAFLRTSFQYNYYALIDMDGDGIPELLAAEELSDFRSSDCPDNYHLVSSADIYTISEGKVCYLSDIWSVYENLSYCTDTHKLRTGQAATGCYIYWFYSIDEEGQLVTEELMYYYGGGVIRDVTSKTYQLNEDITEEEYDRIMEENANTEYLDFTPITRANDAEAEEAYALFSTYATERWFDSDYTYSSLQFTLIPSTFEKCNLYYWIYATVGKPVIVPENMQVGDSFTFVYYGTEYTITNTEDGLVDQYGRDYDYFLDTRILAEYDSDIGIYEDLGTYPLRIQFDAETVEFAMDRYGTVTTDLLSSYSVQQYDKVAFNDAGYVIGLYSTMP